MKKYLMLGVAALALASCNKNDLTPTSQAELDKAKYDRVFKNYIGGEIAANQDWGFGSGYTRGFGLTRSVSTPEVLSINAPYDEAWVTNYCQTAKEPNSTNVTDNYDNTTYASNWDVLNAIPYDGSAEDQLRLWFTQNKDNLSWDELVAWAKQNRPTWISYNKDEDFVLNFKITGTYDGTISVAASEGYTTTTDANGKTVYGDKQDPYCARTMVVTGTWNINADQRIGSGGIIVVANGGELNIASGKMLQMVNHSRLVVLPGGKITGSGLIEVSNGNGTGEENYNGGTINIGTFNNNFGKFHNYGTFKADEYQGGAQESNFYNHSLAVIDHFAGTANARIFNGCQFYVKNDARIRNYEGIMGSSLIVGGQLMCSSSQDGTSTPTYVGLAAGALVQAGSLYNNGTSWTGPTEGGYAVLNIGKFDYMNWEQDHPERGGYFINNIYLVADDLTNVPEGNGMQQKTDDGTEYYTMSKADWKFKNVVANASGNGNTTIAEKGDYEVIPADADFVKGESGCTPGFKIKKNEDPKPGFIRIIAEDLSAEGASDFDFNDVVLDVTYGNPATVVLTHAGGTLPLCINMNEALEVHKLFGVFEGDANAPISTETPLQKMVNTGAGPNVDPVDLTSMLNISIANAAEANTKLKLWVFKNGSWQEMTAPKGEPACKLGVDNTYKVLRERTSIKGEYPLFVDWATKADFTSIWW
jgi:hypothetical protein